MQKRLLASAHITVLSCGIIVGILFERYYSIGKLLLQMGIRTIEFSDTTDRVQADIPTDTPLVILIMGQSNVANTIPLAEKLINHDQDVLNWYQNKLFVAQDPLLGNTGSHGSLWLEVARLLRNNEPKMPVILVPAARNNSGIDDWVSGSYRNLPERIQQQLAKQGLTPDVIIWGQGERDAIDRMSTDAYFSKLKQFRIKLDILYPQTPFVFSITSRCFHYPINDSIRSAQQKIIGMNYTILGPDTDKLGSEYRFDGCHFSPKARDILAKQWAESIQKAFLPR